MLKVGAFVADVRRRGGCARLLQHLFRDIQPQHMGGAVFTGPAAEPAITTAEVDHVQIMHRWQQCLERRPLRRSIEAADGAVQLAVALEKNGIVVDVLRHGKCSFEFCHQRHSGRAMESLESENAYSLMAARGEGAFEMVKMREYPEETRVNKTMHRPENS